MKKIRKLLASMIVGFVVSTNLVACSQVESTQNNAQVSSEIVATVNGIEITESLFNFYLLDVQVEFEQLLGPSVWEMDLDGNDLGDIAKENALKSIVTAIVAEDKAQAMGIEITQEEKVLIKNNAKAYAEANSELLQSHGFSEADVETSWQYSQIIQKVQQQLMENYMPSEEEIQRYVDENIERLGTVTAKHVLIKTKDDADQPLPQEEILRKKALAEEVLERALAGEDMTELAKQYTEDPGSLATGGEYTFGRGQMVPEFEQAAYDGVSGKVWPELVETIFGYHIIKTEAHHPAEEEDVRAVYIENEKMAFVQAEFPNMIDSAVVEKTELYESIQIDKPEDLIEEENVSEDTIEE